MRETEHKAPNDERDRDGQDAVDGQPPRQRGIQGFKVAGVEPSNGYADHWTEEEGNGPWHPESRPVRGPPSYELDQENGGSRRSARHQDEARKRSQWWHLMPVGT